MAANEMKVLNTIHWFRKGLRLHDNPALLAAYEGGAEVRSIFVLDPWFVANACVGINRWRFLQQTLTDLDNSFRKLNSRLFVVRGKPEEVFPHLFREWGVTRLTFEEDTEPYAKTRDAEIERLAAQHGVQVVKRVSHTLYDTDRVISKNGGKPPLTYQRCQTVLTQLGPPPRPAPTLSSDHTAGCVTPLTDSHDATYGVPTMEELGVCVEDLHPCLYPGGETEALERLEKTLNKTSWVCNFEKPKTEPNSLEPSTTVLSPYLKFGCLSVRTFYWALKDVYQGKKHSQPPVSLEGQLLWREFFYTAATGTPNFDCMKGNSVCRQIPWDNKPEFIQAWTEAQTGFPFIDAIMTQLRKEGWIHHLGRHAVACFLTRGDLWCSWEEGQKVFEELLLDADWSLNAGNWMWLSASAFFHQYFRVYSPIAFGKKTDKFGAYIKKYLPVLKKFPVEYIYEPWKAPLGVQRAAGCIIGQNYPKYSVTRATYLGRPRQNIRFAKDDEEPIVQHDIVSKENIKKMAAAYAADKDAKGDTAKSPSQKRPNNTASEPKAKKPKTKKITDFVKK